MDYKFLLNRIFSSFILILFLIIFIFVFQKYIFILFLIIYSFIILEIFLNFKELKNLIYLYVIFSLISLQLYLYFYYHQLIFIYLFFIIFIFDTTCYFIGTRFGKTKLFKIISPKKSYEGLFGGILVTIILSIYFNSLFEIFSVGLNILFVLMNISLSFCGDILQSIFKRSAKIKDSSNFIPGHGGFFDRFDSLIACTFGLLLFNYFFI